MGETRFRVMSNSLQSHQYEVVEIKRFFIFLNFTMREYFFHNTNGNLRNRENLQDNFCSNNLISATESSEKT